MASPDSEVPIPALRDDIVLNPILIEGEQYIAIIDPYSVASENIVIHSDAMAILELLDGQNTLKHLWDSLELPYSDPIADKVTDFVTGIGELGFLANDTFRELRTAVHSKWNETRIRPMTSAGRSYPGSKQEAGEFFGRILSAGSGYDVAKPVKAVLMPHLDLKVAEDVYSPVLQAMQDCKPDLIVMIGTCHYATDGYLIPTFKSYDTPFGILETDTELVQRIVESFTPGILGDDFVHQPEHSLEYPAVVLKFLYGDAAPAVVPLLFTGLHECAADSEDGSKVFTEILCTLRRTFNRDGRRILYVMSGDLSHYGLRFGDDVPASELDDSVNEVEQQVLKALTDADADEWFNIIDRNNDRTRICGLSPVWLGLSLSMPGSGFIHSHFKWSDDATGSAVTCVTATFSD